MGKISITKTNIKDLVIIEPQVFQDDIGYFLETYNETDFQNEYPNVNFVQDNESMSNKGVLRGLHFQTKHTQGKLVRVIKGKVFDVAVDLRKNSDTFGKWEAVILSGENKKQFFVPPGFAHGFMVLEDETIFCYKCTDFYSPEYDSGIIWNDLDLDIKWPIDEIGELSLSQKDMSLQTFKEFLNKENPF